MLGSSRVDGDLGAKGGHSMERPNEVHSESESFGEAAVQHRHPAVHMAPRGAESPSLRHDRDGYSTWLIQRPQPNGAGQ